MEKYEPFVIFLSLAACLTISSAYFKISAWVGCFFKVAYYAFLSKHSSIYRKPIKWPGLIKDNVGFRYITIDLHYKIICRITELTKEKAIN